jgi:hypothetical protein
MRFVVFLFGSFAALLTGALGVGFLLWDTVLAWLIENLPPDALLQAGITENSTTTMTGISYANAGVVTIVAAAYGFLGSIFALFRCGKQGGSLMLIPVLGAAFINPVSLVITSFQAFVALLSFFVGPLPINPPKPKAKAEDEDDDD